MSASIQSITAVGGSACRLRTPTERNSLVPSCSSVGVALDAIAAGTSISERKTVSGWRFVRVRDQDCLNSICHSHDEIASAGARCRMRCWALLRGGGEGSCMSGAADFISLRYLVGGDSLFMSTAGLVRKALPQRKKASVRRLHLDDMLKTTREHKVLYILCVHTTKARHQTMHVLLLSSRILERYEHGAHNVTPPLSP